MKSYLIEIVPMITNGDVNYFINIPKQQRYFNVEDATIFLKHLQDTIEDVKILNNRRHNKL